MKLTVDMPWEKDLSVNHCRMGPRGNWHIKPHVEAWMERLAWEVRAAYGRTGLRLHDDPIGLIVYLSLSFRFPDRRKRDDHNFGYVTANAVAKGLWIDDERIRISTRSVEVDRANPGFTIEIRDEEGT